MAKAIIKLNYKQVIDTSAESDFGKSVLHASYQEFLLKSQTYNQQGLYTTFGQMKDADGRANSLHYKLSFAVGHFIQLLKGRIPGPGDNLGNSLLFETPKFELIDSDITDFSKHKVAIHYMTGDLTLLNSFGEYMVLAQGLVPELTDSETFTIKMQDGLSVVNYRSIMTHPSVINN